MTPIKVLLLALAPALISAHGALYSPVPRNAADRDLQAGLKHDRAVLRAARHERRRRHSRGCRRGRADAVLSPSAAALTTAAVAGPKAAPTQAR